MARHTHRWGVIGALCALLLAPAVATAAQPVAGARYEVHDHKSKGATWHVELEASKRNPAMLRVVVFYDEACGETVGGERIPVTADGVVETGGAFIATDAKGKEQPATWELDARFVTAHRVEGTFRIAEPDCAATRAFGADHGGTHRHTKLGYPDIAAATPRARAQAERLLRGVRASAARRFPTIERARAAGFSRFMVPVPPAPGVFHLWSRRYSRDDRIIHPARPESLVYFEPVDPAAPPVLIAYMYRVHPRSVPRFAGRIPVWHTHKPGGDKMFHVWLTPDLRAAYANCLPVPELERSLHPFKFDDVPTDLHEAQPCPQG